MEKKLKNPQLLPNKTKDEKRRFNIDLPCRVGDTVYCLYQECMEETKVIEVKIDTFEIHKDYVIIDGYMGEYCYRYFLHDLGKTVFLTKEKAKRELRRLSNDRVSK